MATLGSTQVTSDGIDNPLPIGGGIMMEVWRHTGGTVGDTVTFTPKHIKRVLGASSSIASNALSGGSNTNVVLTLVASAATTVTFDVIVLGVP